MASAYLLNHGRGPQVLPGVVE